MGLQNKTFKAAQTNLLGSPAGVQHPHPFSRGGGPLYVTYIFSKFQVSKMKYYIFDIRPKNVSLTFVGISKEIVILHFLGNLENVILHFVGVRWYLESHGIIYNHFISFLYI